MSQALKIWNTLANKPAGKWTFSKMLCLKAPYFSSISPLFERLEPKYCEIKMKKHRAVLNHLGTVHAIAMCNMAELAGGTMTDVTVPATHRWIPKGMQVEYLKKANTDLVAIATPMQANFWWNAGSDYLVQVEVKDTNQDVVFRAIITMWVSAKK
ncbi:hotdog fold domain-containing protein [Acinetobacter sp.]|uniref:hotdog fold domain-containing protein n=1 Tax=Acinetobacter sp. TaxID=472 RepID=UPI003D04E10D